MLSRPTLTASSGMAQGDLYLIRMIAESDYYYAKGKVSTSGSFDGVAGKNLANWEKLGVTFVFVWGRTTIFQ